MKKKDSKKVEAKVNVNDLIDHVSNIVFSNIKLYIDKRFSELDELLETAEDSKVNIATLSTLLHSKKLFSKEEFRRCFVDIRDSFGVVNQDGSIDGKVLITKYNFSA